MHKLSFTTMATPEFNGIEAIKMAKKYGFNGVDMRVSDHKGELTENPSDSEILELKNAFSSEGITPSGLLCYNTKGGADEKSWFEMRDSILRNLEIAYKLGSPSIRIFAGNPNAYENRETYIKKTADTIIDVLDRDGTDIKILIQNHRYGFTAMDCSKAIRIVNNKRFSLVFSPDHCLLEKEDMPTVFKAVKDITDQFYVADVKKPTKDNEHIHALPGEGDVDIGASYRAIGGRDFSGWITFKWERIWNLDLAPADVALPYFIEYFNKIYNQQQ